MAKMKHLRRSISALVVCALTTLPTSTVNAGGQDLTLAEELTSADFGCNAIDPIVADSIKDAPVVSVVSGNVSANSVPIADAIVVAVGPNGVLSGCVSTDSTGDYSGLNLVGPSLIIASAPSGSGFKGLASQTVSIENVASETATANFNLPAATIAVPTEYMWDSQQKLSVPVNTHLVIICLNDNTSQQGPDLLTCGLSRDRSSNRLQPAYDVRLSTAGIPSETRPNVGIYAFGALLLKASPMKPVERLFMPDPSPGQDPVEVIEEIFPLVPVEDIRLTLRDANLGPGDNGGGPNDVPNTNCNLPDEVESQTPFITGTLKNPAGDAGVGYAVELRAFWVDSRGGAGFFGDWAAGSSYWATVGADGAFSFCRAKLPPNFSNPMGPIPAGATARLLAIVRPADTEGRHDVATTVLIVADQAAPTTIHECVTDTTGTKECTLDLQAKAPMIQGFVQKADATPIPFAPVTVYQDGCPGSTPCFPESLRLFTTFTDQDGWFGLATNSPANRTYKVIADRPDCDPSAGTCLFNGLTPSDAYYTTTFNPTNTDNPYEGSAWQGGGTSRTIVLEAANFSGVVTDADGQPAKDGLQAEIWFTCGGGQPPSTVSSASALGGGSSCSTVTARTSWLDGTFAVRLADGEYTVSLYGDTIFAGLTYTVTMSSGSVSQVRRTSNPAATICGGTSGVACAGQITFAPAPTNFNAVVKTDTGVPVEGAQVWATAYVGCAEGVQFCDPFGGSNNGGANNGIWTQTGSAKPKYGGSPRTPGTFGATLAANKIYRFMLTPPYDGSSEATATEVLIKVVDVGGLKFYRCARWVPSPENPQPCLQGVNGEGAPGVDDELPTVDVESATRMLLTMPTANFKAKLCRPATNPCETVGNTWVEIKRFVEGTPVGGFGGANVGPEGLFAYSFSQSGAYTLSLNPPWDSKTGTTDTTLTRTEIPIWVEVTDDGVNVSRATRTGTKIDGSSLETDASVGRYLVRYSTPSLAGRVVDPDGVTPLAYVNVDFFTVSNSSTCIGCRQHYTTVSTDSVGHFAVNLEEGDYTLRANPAWNSSGVTAKEVKIRMQDCDGTAGLEIYLQTAGLCAASPTPEALVDGRYVVALGGSNFVGTLFNPTTQASIAWSSFHYERFNTVTKNYEWVNESWANTNQSGGFGVNFASPGRYRLTFEVPYYLSGQFSKSDVIVDVNESLVATPDLAASGGDGVIKPAASGGRWDVYLRLPNASGKITTPDGSAGVGNAWINVEKWETSPSRCGGAVGCWQWTSEVSGASSDARPSTLGNFAMTLPDGRWRLSVNPPWGQQQYTVSRHEIRVETVEGQQRLCLAAPTETSCNPANVKAPGNLNLALGSPNFTGYVVTESYEGAETGTRPATGFFTSTPKKVSQWSGIRFEKWNAASNNWMWVNTWVNTNHDGYFSSNLTDFADGGYRVTFDPNWSLSDYSATSKYLAVCNVSGAVKLKFDIPETAPADPDAKDWNCGDPDTLATMSSQVTQSVILNGANLRGIVTSSGAPLGDAFVSLLSCTSNPFGGDGDWCNWVRGANTPRAEWNPAGAGKFSFRVDNSGDPVKYRLEVNPPWDSTDGLVRQQFDFYVGEFAGGVGNGSEYCFGSDYNVASKSCAVPHDGSYNWEVPLTKGNLAGKVVTPSANCETPSTCSGMAGAWLQVEKWASMPWNPGRYGWVWQPYWANSSGDVWAGEVAASGTFGLNITTAGLYRVTVNPGWNNPNSYARSTYVISIDGEANWCVKTGVASNALNAESPSPTEATCTPGTDADEARGPRDNNTNDVVTGFTARLVGANLAGLLYDSTASLVTGDDNDNLDKRVGDTWISLQKQFTSRWVWGDESLGQFSEWTYWGWVSGANAGGSFTGSGKGKFGLSISEPGRYRLEVNPAWNNQNASTQFTVEFVVEVSGGCVNGNSDPSNCSIPTDLGPNVFYDPSAQVYRVKYPSPNFAGTLYDKTGSTKLGGAWIGVMRISDGQWIGGASTTWSGETQGSFAMRIAADGLYRVEINPPWNSQTSGLRRQMTMEVLGGSVVSVRSGQDPGSGTYVCDDELPAAPCSNSLELSLLSENVSGRVYYPGSSDNTNDTYATDTEGFQTVMPWASAQAYKCVTTDWTVADPAGCGTWAGWSNSDQEGRIAFSLETDGVYRILVWPNTGYYQAGMLEIDVKIESGAMAAWRYRGESDATLDYGFVPDFGHKKPNVNVTIEGVSSSRFVQVYSCDSESVTDREATEELPAECAGATVVQRLLAVFDSSSSTWRVSLNLEAGVYWIRAVRKSTDGSTDPADVIRVAAETSSSNPENVALDLS